MKKILLFASALAGLFFAGSCQRENLEPVGGNGQVTFTIEAPAAIQTRTIADGLNVNELVYEVWLTNTLGDLTQNAQKLYQATTDMFLENGENKATITLDLVNDQKFTVLFWAQVKEAEAYDTDELSAVTYAKSEYKANDESLAAFYAVAYVNDCQHVKKDGTATGSLVTLRRPFAQLNLGTLNTSTAYDVALVSSKVKVTNANTQFNVATSVASEDKVVEFVMNAVPSNPAKITVNDVVYEYAGMNYLFAGDNATVEYDITTKITTDTGSSSMEGTVNNTVSSVPLKENYRTNIVGNLLTSKVDYQIIVDASWAAEEDEPINISVWDGSSVSEPENDGDIYTIDNSSELAWLAAAVNGTLQQTKAEETAPQTFAGKTFVLNTDVDLDGQEWTPIGNSTTNFKGTFDGNGFTVKNLVVNGGSASNKGLFGVTSEGEVKNLTVENAKVSGRHNVGVVAGTPYTSKYTNITVKGHVEVNGMAYVGGVGGKNAYADWTDITVDVDETSYVKANSIENGTAYRTYVGGVVGCNGEGSHTFSNITSNIDVIGSTCDVGGLFGIAHYGNNFVNCTCSGDVTITDATEAGDAEEIGGIAGVWHNETGYTVTFDGCGFEGMLRVNFTEGVDLTDNDIVGKAYNADGQGTLVIKNSNSVIWVSDAEELQKAADNANNGTTVIKFLNDITGDVTISQTEGHNIIVDGNEKKFDGTFYLHGNARSEGAETLVFRNIAFEHLDASKLDFISCNETGSVERYAHNVTVDNCTFKGNASAEVVGMRYRQCYNMTVKNTTASDLHSLLWATGGNGLSVDNVTLENSKNGLSFGTTNGVVVNDLTVESYGDYGYGIRAKAEGAYTMSVSNSNITAAAPILLRNAKSAAYELTLSGNTLTTTKDYQLIVCANDYEEGVALEEPAVECKITGAEGLVAFPVRVLHEESGLIWNGSNAKKFWITNAEQLYNAVSYFNGQTHSNEGNIVTLELDADIDLAGQDWTPWNVMWIVLNGNNHTISNVTVPAVWRSGFFAYAGATKVNDLTLENVTVSGAQVGVLAGSVEGVTANNVKIAGNNTVNYVPYASADYTETWGGVGAVTGVVQNSTINAEIVSGATVEVNSNGIETEAKYVDLFTGYISANNGTVVNNGTVTGSQSWENVEYAYTSTPEGTVADITTDATDAVVYRGLVSDNVISDLLSVTIGEGVTRLNNRALCKTPTLKEVTLPNSLTYIDAGVFQQSGFKSITIPENVTYIGKTALGACPDLETIIIYAKNVTFANYVGRDSGKLANVYIYSDEVTFEDGSMYFTNKQNGDASNITFYVKNQDIADKLYNSSSASKSYGMKIVSLDGNTTFYNTLK